jgi:hypothetical protein
MQPRQGATFVPGDVLERGDRTPLREFLLGHPANALVVASEKFREFEHAAITDALDRDVAGFRDPRIGQAFRI